MPATVYAFITYCKGDTMSVKTQSVIDRAFALAAHYEALGLVERADAWYDLAFSLAELVS